VPSGNVLAFGSPNPARLAAVPVNFGQVSVGKSGPLTMVITAEHPVMVRRIWIAEPSGSTRRSPSGP
jgi:hypothetical protein